MVKEKDDEEEEECVAHVEFDGMGCLFAVAGMKGSAKVFDFDKVRAGNEEQVDPTCVVNV